MSTHGRGGVGRWIYGSVADHLLRHAQVPVLLTSAAAQRVWAEGSPLRVLVPLDGSALAEEVLARLGALPAALRGELILARVVEMPSTAYTMYAGAYLGYDPQPELEPTLAEPARALLERLRRTAHAPAEAAAASQVR
jgi:nucleotide-binding universal stress UspA family protein